MIEAGDIVTFWHENDNCYYMGVAMEIKEITIVVQDLKHEQHEVPVYKVKHADSDDMSEELRSIYGFYN